MAKYVNVDTLKNILYERNKSGEFKSIMTLGAVDEVAELLDELPAANVIEIKSGHWIYPNSQTVSCICSVCNWKGRYYEDDVSFESYCPHCGAKLSNMEEINDDA